MRAHRSKWKDTAICCKNLRASGILWGSSVEQSTTVKQGKMDAAVQKGRIMEQSVDAMLQVGRANAGLRSACLPERLEREFVGKQHMWEAEKHGMRAAKRSGISCARQVRDRDYY